MIIYLVFREEGAEYETPYENLLGTFETLEEAKKYGDKFATVPNFKELQEAYEKFEAEEYDYQSDEEPDEAFLKKYTKWTCEDLNELQMWTSYSRPYAINIKKLETGVPAKYDLVCWKIISNSNKGDHEEFRWIGEIN